MGSKSKAEILKPKLQNERTLAFILNGTESHWRDLRQTVI